MSKSAGIADYGEAFAMHNRRICPKQRKKARRNAAAGFDVHIISKSTAMISLTG